MFLPQVSTNPRFVLPAGKSYDGSRQSRALLEALLEATIVSSLFLCSTLDLISSAPQTFKTWVQLYFLSRGFVGLVWDNFKAYSSFMIRAVGDFSLFCASNYPGVEAG